MSVTPSSQSTPMPSDPASPQNDVSFLLSDRSLTDMLASTNPMRQNDLNDNKEKFITSDMEKIISLESHLTASEIYPQRCHGSTSTESCHKITDQSQLYCFVVAMTVNEIRCPA